MADQLPNEKTCPYAGAAQFNFNVKFLYSSERWLAKMRVSCLSVWLVLQLSFLVNEARLMTTIVKNGVVEFTSVSRQGEKRHHHRGHHRPSHNVSSDHSAGNSRLSLLAELKIAKTSDQQNSLPETVGDQQVAQGNKSSASKHTPTHHRQQLRPG